MTKFDIEPSDDEAEIADDILLENTAGCSQFRPLLGDHEESDECLRECIKLNVIKPLRTRLAKAREKLAAFEVNVSQKIMTALSSPHTQSMDEAIAHIRREHAAHSRTSDRLAAAEARIKEVKAFAAHELTIADARIKAAEARIAELEGVLRHTHTTYCTEDWTDRGLHAPECLLYKVERQLPPALSDPCQARGGGVNSSPLCEDQDEA